MSLTAAQADYVDNVLALSPLMSFDEARHTFDVTEACLDWGQIQSLGRVLSTLRNTPPPPPFSGVRVADLTMGYYDRCLEQYAAQRYQEGRAHGDTCWIRFAENTFCLGRTAPGAPFGDAERVRLLTDLGTHRDNHIHTSIHRAWRRDPALAAALQPDADGWLLFRADIPIRSVVRRKRIKAAARSMVRRLQRVPDEDRVLGIIRSIELHGWRDDLARTPSVSVLGYSRSRRRYMALTGRHRVAAVRYLHRQGKVADETFMEVPILTYPWDSWLHGRPHPTTPLCEGCR
jgi:hypothetical protein